MALMVVEVTFCDPILTTRYLHHLKLVPKLIDASIKVPFTTP